MLDIGQQTSLRHAIASQLVGHDYPRHILQAPEKPLEEALGGFPITPLLDQNIQDDTILINGSPQIMLDALDPDEYFVEVPLVARPGTAAAQTISKALAEFLAPAPYRLVGDNDGPLSQQQLNVPQAEAEHVIRPHRMADDLSGEAMAVVRVRGRLHAASLDRAHPRRKSRLP